MIAALSKIIVSDVNISRPSLCLSCIHLHSSTGTSIFLILRQHSIARPNAMWKLSTFTRCALIVATFFILTDGLWYSGHCRLASGYRRNIPTRISIIPQVKDLFCWENELRSCNSCESGSCGSDERCVSGQCLVLVGNGRESRLDPGTVTAPSGNRCSRCRHDGECSSGECIKEICMTMYGSGQYVCFGNV